MSRVAKLLIVFAVSLCAQISSGQIRVVPDPHSRPGKAIGTAWENVTGPFRTAFEFPVWPIPTDLAEWETNRRRETRDQAIALLGQLPPRLERPSVRTVRTEDRGDHVAEYFELDNGFDTSITGLLLRPKVHEEEPLPAIVVMHAWSGDKDSLLTRADRFDGLVGPMLVRKGFIVAAIDGYFHGDRIGKGPNDLRDVEVNSKSRTKDLQQRALVGINLWFGRTLFGMMVRDQQCLVDYLASRPDVDSDRIGATGASLGNTTGFWLAAIDDRVKAFVGVVCFTRLEQLIQQGYVQSHAVYYYVPNMLKHFDTEAVFSLIAPRPMLQLNGDGDPTSPIDGIEILEDKVGQVYRLYRKADQFQSVVYRNTGHAYLPDMKQRMVTWFEKYLAGRE